MYDPDPSLVNATFSLVEGALLIFLLFGVEKLLAWLGIESTTLDFSSQAGIYKTFSFTEDLKVIL